MNRTMVRRAEEDNCRCFVEVHGFTREEREVTLCRLHEAFAASGCWLLEYRRRRRHSVEYNFEVELGAVMELYCGLVHAGVEMTEVSHRAITDLCVLRLHERALHGTPRVVSVRLVMSFLEAEETDVFAAVAASA